jgi:O-antigen/teichoic acid export membrane protein
MFLVNAFLGPVAVGLYSIAVGLVEKLWMVSFAASTVLFPRVAAETEAQRQEKFTPLVARTVLWVTSFGALALALLSRWVVLLLYSEAFLPAVGALQALLMGIVALSAGRVLANDIAGRGFPRLNIYTGFIAVATNVVLNLFWIPRYGIAGAGWASTVSYTLCFLGILFLYCRLSGHSWTILVFPQPGDWQVYWSTGKALAQWAWGKVKAGL